mmetsp:Transcript_68917/g.222767  ORF Transcript_68917/g.222767 Transcript_68917/m.222767 type:complete len:207 (+) Transcript_68917:78-698(+)
MAARAARLLAVPIAMLRCWAIAALAGVAVAPQPPHSPLADEFLLPLPLVGLAGHRSRSSPETPAADGRNRDAMEKINKMGRELCKDRPNHEICRIFRDAPEEADIRLPPAPAPAPAAAPAAAATPATEAADVPAAPVDRTAPAPAPTAQQSRPRPPPVPTGAPPSPQALDRWGKALLRPRPPAVAQPSGAAPRDFVRWGAAALSSG